METLVIDREVLHQLARRARGDGDKRGPEPLGEAHSLAVSAAARRIADATAVRGAEIEISVTG